VFQIAAVDISSYNEDVSHKVKQFLGLRLLKLQFYKIIKILKIFLVVLQ